MDSTFELYQMEGDEEEFWSQRPNLDDAQIELLRCWHVARGETESDKRCSLEILNYALKNAHYETDLAIEILKNLDSHYMNLRLEKLKRLNSNGR